MRLGSCSNHGGLNEYVDNRWIKRNPSLVEGNRHWKNREMFTELEVAEQAEMDGKIFTSVRKAQQQKHKAKAVSHRREGSTSTRQRQCLPLPFQRMAMIVGA